ncbi:hypothetical protein B0H14DRAFT_2875157 [Mycena olivaceomarginata]|nr:hypothetical protein B0H14DRAFT_2875157 [Mycena olivaceomarginata]
MSLLHCCPLPFNLLSQVFLLLPGDLFGLFPIFPRPSCILDSLEFLPKLVRRETLSLPFEEPCTPKVLEDHCCIPFLDDSIADRDILLR